MRWLRESTPRCVLSVAAWAACALCIASGTVTLVLEPINRSGPYKESDLYPGAFVIAILFPLVGALVATRRPRNWVGWILIGMGLSEAASALTAPYAIFALFTRPGPPGGALASWIAAWSWLPGFSLTALLLLVFPTGRLLSRRWQAVAWAAALGTALETLAIAIASWPLRGPYLIIHRDGVNPETAGAVLGALDAVAFVLLLASLLASVVSIVVRFRRAGGVERRQIKWFTYAAPLVRLAVAQATGQPRAIVGSPPSLYARILWRRYAIPPG